jgi:hypothetical protein
MMKKVVHFQQKNQVEMLFREHNDDELDTRRKRFVDKNKGQQSVDHQDRKRKETREREETIITAYIMKT